MGGPIAFLVNKKHINSLINDFSQLWKNNKNLGNDLMLLHIINKKDYVCREPQLGYERPEGGSLFN